MAGRCLERRLGRVTSGRPVAGLLFGVTWSTESHRTCRQLLSVRFSVRDASSKGAEWLGVMVPFGPLLASDTAVAAGPLHPLAPTTVDQSLLFRRPKGIPETRPAASLRLARRLGDTAWEYSVGFAERSLMRPPIFVGYRARGTGHSIAFSTTDIVAHPTYDVVSAKAASESDTVAPLRSCHQG
jgi:hypothetical protein